MKILSSFRLLGMMALTVAAMPGALLTVQSYSTVNGQAHTFNYRDKTYNGAGNPAVSLSPLSGGTGLLTDGVTGGGQHFTADLGNGVAFEWVGWAQSNSSDPVDAANTNPTIIFRFAGGAQAINSISLFIDNLGSVSGVGLFNTAEISFGSDGTNFGNTVTYNTTPAEQADLNARFITIALGQSAEYVKVHLVRSQNWVFLSEVQFDGGSGFTPTPEPSTLLLSAGALLAFGLSRRRA